MCGIIGYTGNRRAIPVIMEGLKNLEYRGYDSAGISLEVKDGLFIEKCEGKLSKLEDSLRGLEEESLSCTGIGHVRWATHGSPTRENAHPFRCGAISIVHNGIIENYRDIKEILASKGYSFTSRTDTEVAGFLIWDHMKGGMDTGGAIREACRGLSGSFAFAILSERDPGKVFGVRSGSPLVAGMGNGEHFLSSDIPAIAGLVKEFVHLEDGEIVEIGADGVVIHDLDGKRVRRKPFLSGIDHISCEKGGYKHFMLKEIFEQGSAIMNTMAGRIDPETRKVFIMEVEEGFGKGLFSSINRIVVIACGTSYHAGLVGKYLLERELRIPVDVELASEFRYRDPIIDEKTLAIFITQSGETKDTLEALYESKRRGAKTLSICNVPGSTITRASHAVIPTHAGPERAVASTKSFTTQIATLHLLSLMAGQALNRGMEGERRATLTHILSIPRMVERVLKRDREYLALARNYQYFNHFLYLGRGISTPLAMEGALKLKEISYIHAEAYAGGEMKHGPIALISPDMPSLVLAPADATYPKIVSNIEEIKSRGGAVIAVGFEGDRELEERVDDFIPVPETPPFLFPYTITIPLQLFAYHIANMRGNDVDQPRNLAKSVTVE